MLAYFATMNTPRTDQSKRKARDGYESDVVVDARICAEIETEKMHAESILRRIIADLPQNRDWLDPQLEREARAILRANADVLAPAGEKTPTTKTDV